MTSFSPVSDSILHYSVHVTLRAPAYITQPTQHQAMPSRFMELHLHHRTALTSSKSKRRTAALVVSWEGSLPPWPLCAFLSIHSPCSFLSPSSLLSAPRSHDPSKLPQSGHCLVGLLSPFSVPFAFLFLDQILRVVFAVLHQALDHILKVVFASPSIRLQQSQVSFKLAKFIATGLRALGWLPENRLTLRMGQWGSQFIPSLLRISENSIVAVQIRHRIIHRSRARV